MQQKSASAFSTTLRIYIEDTDAGGIVYYVNYLKFMERCRTEFLRSLGYDKPAILDGGKLLVVHSAQVSYRRPARLDDQLQITAAVTRVARTYIDFSQRVTKDAEVLCNGTLRIACVIAETMKPCALPAQMYEQLKSHAGNGLMA